MNTPQTVLGPIRDSFQGLWGNKKTITLMALTFALIVSASTVIPYIGQFIYAVGLIILTPTIIYFATHKKTAIKTAFASSRQNILPAFLWFLQLFIIVIAIVTTLTLIVITTVIDNGNETIAFLSVLIAILALVIVVTIWTTAVAAAAVGYRNPLQVAFKTLANVKSVLTIIVTYAITWLLQVIVSLPLLAIIASTLLSTEVNTAPTTGLYAMVAVITFVSFFVSTLTYTLITSTQGTLTLDRVGDTMPRRQPATVPIPSP